ncbi:hypothetical protein PPERSA_03218 [Pseudocohnilembus persalinus]|uniref:Leucine rich repeat protein n=1 Tax=Pseudocohnilembus persalinus TaxID=266149 RepID=A0A0V0QE60_PSEPJ|nr:hypothetical protein PPERSA_03218 [Pseudocohnilembus persalinus]|eukprot:KRX00485.1 hypothetical protein PPERSA_03218 [Pseudocohnilembus persalinus]
MSDNGLDEGEEQQEIESEVGELIDQVPPKEQLVEILQKKIKQGLSVMGKTVETSSWAFTQLNCDGNNITDLYEVLYQYPHLRQISLARNKIEDCTSFTSIKYLCKLDLRQNNIQNFDQFNKEGQLEFLEELNLADNRLNSLDAFQLKNLKKLILDQNEISSAEKFQGHPSLQYLSLIKNKLQQMKELKDMPQLKTLIVQNNPIEQLSGLQNCNNLEILNLKNTQIEFLSAENLPELPSLKNLNFDDCKKLASLKEFENLNKYEKTLQIISCLNTPVQEENADIKKELIMFLPKLLNINEEPVEEDEVQAALQEKKEREEELLRQQQEEEEARRQAEEEAKNQENQQQEEDED